MTRLESRARLFAFILSALAGFVDAIGFIQSGGFFVSFMSGNSTRLGVGAAEGALSALVAAAIILCFLVGVIGGTLLGARFERQRPAAVLSAIAAAIALAALVELRGGAGLGYGIALLALAMGAENAVFERDGEVRFGVTYMTGSLVRVGNGIASAILGRDGNGWAAYLLLWLAVRRGRGRRSLRLPSGRSREPLGRKRCGGRPRFRLAPPGREQLRSTARPDAA